jgi:hypothetical protein
MAVGYSPNTIVSLFYFTCLFCLTRKFLYYICYARKVRGTTWCPSLLGRLKPVQPEGVLDLARAR